jgi:hypothetical protein
VKVGERRSGEKGGERQKRERRVREDKVENIDFNI